jgi:cytochrome c556
MQTMAKIGIVAAGLVLAGAHEPRAQDHQHHAAGAGQHAATPDNRREIVLAREDRDFVLTEMRAFLESVRDIASAVAEGKPAAAAAAAKRSGMGATHDVPASLRAKLPAEWKTLGMDTHRKFDALALEAASIGDATQITRQLASVLDNCTACHAAFRLTAP